MNDIKLEPTRMYYLREKVVYQEEGDYIMERLILVTRLHKEKNGTIYVDGVTHSFKRDMKGKMIGYVFGEHTTNYLPKEGFFEIEEVRELSIEEAKILLNKLKTEWEKVSLNLSQEAQKRTYDIVFIGETCTNRMGLSQSYEYCKEYISSYNGSNESYFEFYKGGEVQIICNETAEVVYRESIPARKISRTKSK